MYCEKIVRSGHTTIETPPLFLVMVRAPNRPAMLRVTDESSAPDSIMTRQQMSELQSWLKSHDTSTALLVSSVPVLLPPLIGFAEYMMGVRPLHGTPLRRLGRLFARIQQSVTRRMSFDHWPVFSATWRELVKLLSNRTHDIVVRS